MAAGESFLHRRVSPLKERAMQISQLFRRGVVRPLDDEAARQLATFTIDDSIRTEWLPILGDSQFAEIWNTGILQCLNEACRIRISDYEEVELRSSQLGLALQVIRRNLTNIGSSLPFFQKLDELLSEASDSERNVYFIF